MTSDSDSETTQYPDWLRKAASKGGKAKSAAKTAAARANAKLGGRPRKPKRVARRANNAISKSHEI